MLPQNEILIIASQDVGVSKAFIGGLIGFRFGCEKHIGYSKCMFTLAIFCTCYIQNKF